MKGTKTQDFFGWLHECKIDTSQIPEEAKKNPGKWIGFEYEVTDPDVSAFPLKVDFKAMYDAESDSLKIADSSVVESKTNEQPEKIKITTGADGARKIEVATHVAQHPFHSYPRNLPCYCGSGVKFKKCHLLALPTFIKGQEEANIKQLRNWFVNKAETMGNEDYSEFCREYFTSKIAKQPTAPQP